LVNNGAAGYFQGMTSGTVIVFFILALLAICGIVVLRQFEVAKALSARSSRSLMMS
jgi:hypothetical protein